MPGRDIIVVGASAGGIEALIHLVRELPADLPATLLVVVHIQPDAPSALPAILQRSGALPASHPRDDEMIRQRHIYCAPPDRHLIVRRGQVQVTRGPRENRFRPSVDVLFRSAALAYGRRAIGVVLSGSLDDGAAGLAEIKQAGGVALVQDPADALFSSMPEHALMATDVDACLPVATIAERLVELVYEPLELEGAEDVNDDAAWETDAAALDPSAQSEDGHPGQVAPYGCPECAGTLWQIEDGKLIRFRCRVGHAYSANTLMQEMSETLEEALWIALRVLRERESLSRRLLSRAESTGLVGVRERFAAQAEESAQLAETIRRALNERRDQTG